MIMHDYKVKVTRNAHVNGMALSDDMEIRLQCDVYPMGNIAAKAKIVERFKAKYGIDITKAWNYVKVEKVS